MNMVLKPKQVGAYLHTLLNSTFSRVPSCNMGKMRLIHLHDLPLLIAVGPSKMGKMIGRLRTFQSNLDDDDWPSLAEIYPRPYLWMYAYLLFFWGRYCHTLPLLLAEPDRSLPAEIYLRFICQIDTYLDSFDSRGLLDEIVPQIEGQPGVQTVRADLFRRLDDICENTNDRDHLSGLVNTYLDQNLVAFRRWMSSETMTLNEIEAFKETTTGGLYATWSRILGGLFHLPDELSLQAARIVSRFGMAIQVVDDIADAGQDYLVHSANIFLGIATDMPAEYDHLISHIENIDYKYLQLSWVKKNMPGSYARSIDLICSYVEEINAISRQTQVTDELINLISTLLTFAGHENIKLRD